MTSVREQQDISHLCAEAVRLCAEADDLSAEARRLREQAKALAHQRFLLVPKCDFPVWLDDV